VKNNGKLACRSCWKVETANKGKRCNGCVAFDLPFTPDPSKTEQYSVNGRTLRARDRKRAGHSRKRRAEQPFLIDDSVIPIGAAIRILSVNR
jgi:hypothetical protein